MKKLLILVIPALVFMLTGCGIELELEDKEQERKTEEK